MASIPSTDNTPVQRRSRRRAQPVFADGETNMGESQRIRMARSETFVRVPTRDDFSKIQEGGSRDAVLSSLGTPWSHVTIPDPEDSLAKIDFAILLEHDSRGVRYAPDARVAEAVALYRAVLKKPASPMVQQNLTFALLRSGQLNAAKQEAQKCSPDLQSGILAVITVLQEGPARAIMNAQALYPDPSQRANQLAQVAVTLVQMREYEKASVIMNAAARAVPNYQIRADLVAKLKKWENVMAPETDPLWPVQQLLLAMFHGNLDVNSLKPLFSSRAKMTAPADDIPSLRNSLAAAKQQIAGIGLEEEAVLDFLFSLASFEKDGQEDRGYRITTLAAGGANLPSMYVARENGKYRLLGSGANGSELIGETVLDLLDKNDLKGAQWWLDTVVKFIEVKVDGTGSPSVVGLWSGTKPELRGAGTARIAAASLIGAGTGDPKSLKILEEARLKAANATEKAELDKAICETLDKAGKWDELMTAARRMEASSVFAEEGFRYFVKGASAAKRWKDLETEAQKRVATNATNLHALRMVGFARLQQGNTAGAFEITRKLLGSNVATTDDRIFSAWVAILGGKADAGMLNDLKKGSEHVANSAYQYTLAMLEASLNMPDDAERSLMRGINNEDYSDLSAAAWAAYAGICEQYGFKAEAAAASERASASAFKGDELADYAHLLVAHRQSQGN